MCVPTDRSYLLLLLYIVKVLASMPACLTQHCMLNFNRQACDNDEFQQTSIAISIKVACMAFPTDDHVDDDCFSLCHQRRHH